ncbi:MAG: hypothetical protein HY823_07735 [Acidobacteria bacterium]|nr:hypothetical protein [Acidobacteriota bacterium]
MRPVSLLVGLLLAAPLAADIQKTKPAGPQAVQDAKRQDAIRLMGILDWPRGNSEAAKKQLEAAAKDPNLKNFPAAYWKDYAAAATPEAFEAILVPLVEKVYTAQELKNLVKLLSSPEMKTVADKHPEALALLLDKAPGLIKPKAYEAFSKHMTEVGKKLQEKHGVKLPPKK